MTMRLAHEVKYDGEMRARSEAQTRTILEHLREGVESGQVYFRSADVADALGMSTQCVGSRIGSAARSGETGGLRIEKWAQTVWRVTAGAGP
jgi:prophage antirepressor-like protein